MNITDLIQLLDVLNVNSPYGLVTFLIIIVGLCIITYLNKRSLTNTDEIKTSIKAIEEENNRQNIQNNSFIEQQNILNDKTNTRLNIIEDKLNID